MTDTEIRFGDLAVTLKKTFRDFDPGSTGKIGKRELAGVLRECDKSLSQAELDVLFNHADKNGDGAIQYEEFIDLIFDLGGDTSDMKRPADASLCINGCGRPRFGKYKTCCTRCRGPDGPHARDCESKAAAVAEAVALPMELCCVAEPMEMCCAAEPMEPEPPSLTRELQEMRERRVEEERQERLRTSTDKEEVLSILKSDISLRCRLGGIQKTILADKDFAVRVVSWQGYLIQYFPDEVKADRTIATAAVNKEGRAIKFLPEALQQDFEMMMAAVMQDGDALEELEHAGRNNKKIVLAAMSQNPRAYCYASDKIKDDRDVALVAASREPWVLKHMSNRMANDREVILAAIKTDAEGMMATLDCTKSNLRMDREIVELLLASDRWGLRYVGSNDMWDAANLSVYKCVHPEGCWLKEKLGGTFVDEPFEFETKAMAKYGPTAKPVLMDPDEEYVPAGPPDIEFNEEVEICAEVVADRGADKSRGLFLALPQRKVERGLYKAAGWAREFTKDGARVLEKIR